MVLSRRLGGPFKCGSDILHMSDEGDFSNGGLRLLTGLRRGFFVMWAMKEDFLQRRWKGIVLLGNRGHVPTWGDGGNFLT